MFTKLFSEISKADVEIAGGKGASLGEMTGAGIPVPPGFVIISVAHDQFHAKAIPHDVQQEVLGRFRQLNAPFVAVRSSANVEDGAHAAWAGQLDTFLNTTEETLLQNVQRCWDSIHSDRALAYAEGQDLDVARVSVAVVVQHIIQSEVSGVAFSVHPVTQDRNQLIIEAGWGLGEAIVSGAITPDSYVVDTVSWNLLDVNVSEQERMIGRQGWEDVSIEKREIQKLSSDRIVELARLVKKIESHYSFPVDVEWAFADGMFFITQSRPITTLTRL